jgi:hypothetical protein
VPCCGAFFPHCFVPAGSLRVFRPAADRP